MLYDTVRALKRGGDEIFLPFSFYSRYILERSCDKSKIACLKILLYVFREKRKGVSNGEINIRVRVNIFILFSIGKFSSLASILRE